MHCGEWKCARKIRTQVQHYGTLQKWMGALSNGIFLANGLSPSSVKLELRITLRHVQCPSHPASHI